MFSINAKFIRFINSDLVGWIDDRKPNISTIQKPRAKDLAMGYDGIFAFKPELEIFTVQPILLLNPVLKYPLFFSPRRRTSFV
jgi:hypothetical protein